MAWSERVTVRDSIRVGGGTKAWRFGSRPGQANENDETRKTKFGVTGAGRPPRSQMPLPQMNPTPHRRRRFVTCLMAVASIVLLVVACGRGPSTGPEVPPAGETNFAETLRGDLIEILPPTNRVSVPESPKTEPSVSILAALAAAFTGTVLEPIEPEPTHSPRAVSNPAMVLPPSREGTNEVLHLRFNTLSSFSYTVRLGQPEPGGRPNLVTRDKIPTLIQALNGRRVAVTGYVMPLRTQGRGVTQFLLARDQLSCCFGPSPQMNHWIYVTMPRGDFRPRVFSLATVTGTLHVGELMKQGVLQSIYRMDAEMVELNPETPPPIAQPSDKP